MYCGDSEDFYLEMLKTTLENNRTSPIREAYAQQDWKQYGICMHSLSVCIHSMPLSLPKKVSHHIFCDVRLFIGVFYCVNVSSPA